MLGISCLFNVDSTTIEEMGRICKDSSPQTSIVIGGHYPTNEWRDVLEKKVCNYVILGEAEEEFVWLLNNMGDPLLREKIFNNPYVVDIECIDNSNKKPAIIQDLDALPMPAWDLLPHHEEYIAKSLHSDRMGSAIAEKEFRSAGIMTSRGCPMRCTFCAAHKVHGRKTRVHSVDYMMQHIQYLVDNYDINNLLIEDDMFNLFPKRTTEFCNVLRKKFGNRFTIEFPNGLALWTLNEEIVENLKSIGLKTATIAIESGNQYVQNNILKKKLDLDVVKDKVRLLKKHDIKIRAFFIIGLVGETIEMMEETINFAQDLNIDWCEFKVFTPLVGSEMHAIAKEKGYLIGDTSEHIYGRCRIKTPDFTPAQVEELRYDANIRINFLNNSSLKRNNFDKAEKIFLKLLNVYPDHLFAQWGLWKSLEGEGKKVEAKSALERVIQLSKNKENMLLLERYKIKL